MRIKASYFKFVPVYIMILSILYAAAIYGSNLFTVWNESRPCSSSVCIVIDPGHGGIDGGATSCTGARESTINLEIAIRLKDFFHLLGYETKMIREDDTSVYKDGKTIAAQKISDLHERVRMVNDTENAVLISIHQNYFENPKYDGAQVFFSKEESSILANNLQNAMIEYLNHQNNRKAKKVKNIYLIDHVKCPAVLIECGFLSNPIEECCLRNEEYQKKLSCVIGAKAADYICIKPAVS